MLFALYIIAELNKPKPIDWTVTLSKGDKNPYGGYIVFNQLKDLFPSASIQSYRLPVYNQLNNYVASHTAYAIISPSFNPSKNDWEEMKNYVRKGNYVLLAASNFNKLVLESLRLKTFTSLSIALKDSTAVNFVNPALKSKEDYVFRKNTIDEYFSSFDTSVTKVLAINTDGRANFIKVGLGKGAFLVHAAPICFSNYFMLFRNNAEYTAKALSYLPADITTLYWDEYYKLGAGGPKTPLRFFLANDYLSWALWLSIIGLVVYILFEMKRRQRVIPIITPLKNSTLHFIETVSSVYYNQKDNASIASKKVAFFLDFVRQRFHLQTQALDENFEMQLARKSGVDKEEVTSIVSLLREIDYGYAVSDGLLLRLNQQIDNFYKQVR